MPFLNYHFHDISDKYISQYFLKSGPRTNYGPPKMCNFYGPSLKNKIGKHLSKLIINLSLSFQFLPEQCQLFPVWFINLWPQCSLSLLRKTPICMSSYFLDLFSDHIIFEFIFSNIFCDFFQKKTNFKRTTK